MMNSHAVVELFMQTGPVQTMYKHTNNKTCRNLSNLVLLLNYNFTKAETPLVQAIVQRIGRHFVCHLAVFNPVTAAVIGVLTSKLMILPDNTYITIPLSVHNSIAPF